MPVLVLMVLLASQARAQEGPKPAPRIVIVVSQSDFTDREYFEARAVFERAQAGVLVVSTDEGYATSHDGRRIQVDAAIRSLMTADFGALVLIGGMGVLDTLSNSELLRSALKAAVREHKVVAAICLAPVVLAKAGVLRNREATCFNATPVIAELKRNGAIYSDQDVVNAGGVITANGPDAAAVFAAAVLEEMEKAAHDD